MKRTLRRYILAAVAVVAAGMVNDSVARVQLPEPLGPPLDDESELPADDVPVVKRDITQPFSESGDQAVLDDRLPAEDRMDVINGEDLRPGEEPTFNQQLPGYEAEAVRMLNNPMPAAEDETTSQDGEVQTEDVSSTEATDSELAVGEGSGLDSDAGLQPNSGQYQPIPQQLSRRERKRLMRESKNNPQLFRNTERESFIISGGRRVQTFTDADVAISSDTLVFVERRVPDSLAVRETVAVLDSMADSLAGDSMSGGVLSRRLQRQLKKAMWRADSTYYRHSPMFRDTLKIAPFTALSAVVPGFGQFYNSQYWKIPVLYAAAGTAVFLGVKQHQQYRNFKNEYEYLIGRSAFSTNRNLIDPVQTRMIQHNTWRQVFFGAAIASYVYFIEDAIYNYPAAGANRVKTATTMSLVCPGAGQIYNGSFWKLPLVVGGFASFIYVIDWNNRGYQRYDRAIRLETDGDPDTNKDSSFGSMSLDQLRNYKKLYRRNRDLSIILTAAFYLLNIMDAHVDAYFQDFDTGPDLAYQLRLHPVIEPLYAYSGFNSYSVGLGLSLTF